MNDKNINNEHSIAQNDNIMTIFDIKKSKNKKEILTYLKLELKHVQNNPNMTRIKSWAEASIIAVCSATLEYFTTSTTIPLGIAFFLSFAEGISVIRENNGILEDMRDKISFLELEKGIYQGYYYLLEAYDRFSKICEEVTPILHELYKRQLEKEKLKERAKNPFVTKKLNKEDLDILNNFIIKNQLPKEETELLLNYLCEYEQYVECISEHMESSYESQFSEEVFKNTKSF